MDHLDIATEIRAAEAELVREIFPEFDDVPERLLALVLELFSVQWAVFQVLKDRGTAEKVNDMLLALVYRVVDDFPEFERGIMHEKLKQENVLANALNRWLQKKREFQQHFEQMQQNDPNSKNI
jgi:5'-deoxynucleotidase YfbR-like HD superfamily hydrolase